MRNLVVVAIVLALACSVVAEVPEGFQVTVPMNAIGQSSPAPTLAPVPDAVVDVVPGKVAEVEVKAKVKAEGGRKLTSLEKRKLGFTYRNTKRIVRELKAGGFINEYTYQSEIDKMVSGVIRAEADPDVVAEIEASWRAEGMELAADPNKLGGFWDEVDWDEVFAFLEKLIALIMPFFL